MSLKARVEKLLRATPDTTEATLAVYPRGERVYRDNKYVGVIPLGEPVVYPAGGKITRRTKVLIGVDIGRV